MARTKKAPEEAPEITAQEAEPVEVEAPAPSTYEATVLCRAAIRREPDGIPIGTIPAGAPVTVARSRDGYAQLSNGVFLKEDFLKK